MVGTIETKDVKKTGQIYQYCKIVCAKLEAVAKIKKNDYTHD